MLRLKDVALKGQRVLIREDLNLPIEAGVITNRARLEAALPSIEAILNAGAACIILSHLGRPTEGQFDERFSLAPVAVALEEALQKPIRFETNWLEGFDISPGEVVLCENVRFQPGEKANAPELAKKIALLADVFVMDAFGASHRAHASTVGVAEFAPVSCAGPLLESELNALNRIFQQPKPPVLAIVGGSKVSTKLEVLDTLIEKVDALILGGGIANTFLAAVGIEVAKSLYEPGFVDSARAILKKAKERGVQLPLPTDVVVAKSMSNVAQTRTINISALEAEEAIFDIGPETSAQYAKLIAAANTLVWNGPVGVFELTPFSEGTKALSQAIAESRAFSVAGGGDTIAAIDAFDIRQAVSYISTGGGAFLAFLEGKELPAVAALCRKEAPALC